jgi:uncharacterized protein (TIGR00369 family)
VPGNETVVEVRLGGGHVLDELAMRRVDDPTQGPSLEMDVRRTVSNPHGGLHGGLMTAFIECGAAGIAVRAGGSENIVATDMNVRFLSPVRAGPARVVGKVIRIGRRSIVVQVEVLDMGQLEAGEPKLAATGSLSYARLDTITPTITQGSSS